MNHHAAAGGRFPCLTEKRLAIKLTTLTTSTWWLSRMENPLEKIQFCSKSWLTTLAIEPPSSPCRPAPTLRRRLHFRWLSWAAKHAWQQQTLFPLGILKEQMILYCHSAGGTTLEDVNECHDCHAADLPFFGHPRTKQLKLHFLDTYSTASTKPSFLSWQRTVTRGVWVLSSQRILSCPHTPHLMPKFSSSTSAASSA